MKKVKLLLILLVFALCTVQVGSALKINNLEITPTGDLQVGDTVTVRGTVDLGSSTFDEDNYLEFFTQLDRSTVQWKWAIGVEGKYPPATTGGGSYLRIDGWLLSYPDLSVDVQVEVDGVVPDTVTSGSLMVFRARELDEDDEVVGTEVLKEKTVFNPAQLAAQIAAMEGRLASLKTRIEEAASAGISVGEAQTYYTAAKNAISSARSASGGEVTGYLSAAEIAISDGNTALDRAWAQQSIDQAQHTIDSIIGLYNEFTMIRSLEASDPRLVPIIQKRDLAIMTLSNAKDEQADGNYASARAKAIESKARADEALALSQALKEQLDGVIPPTTPPVTTSPVTPTSPSPTLTGTTPITTTLTPDESELERLRRENLAFEEQNRRLQEENSILLQIIKMLQRILGFMWPFQNPPPVNPVTSTPTTIPSPTGTPTPEQTTATTSIDRSVSAIVRQIGYDIMVTDQGGSGHKNVNYFKININGIDQGAPGYRFSPNIGSVYTCSKAGTPRNDEVVVTAFFNDGSSQVILDTFV